MAHGRSSTMCCAPCYDHSQSQQQVCGAPTAAVLQQSIPSRMETIHQSVLALGYSGIASERAMGSCFGVGSLPDAGCLGDYRPAAEFMSSSNSRHERDIRPGMGVGSSSSGSGAASVAIATLRRKSEERVGGNAKKSKQEGVAIATQGNDAKGVRPLLSKNLTLLFQTQPQVPRAKITAPQQIVSPFGKTDASSVLFETIKYIQFLHDQPRLFSQPYMTKIAYKSHVRFGGEGKEEKAGTGLGLSLVPVSVTSQVYHDDTLSDCWMPAYRSLLYQ